MSNKYEKLDSLIVLAIQRELASPLYDRACNKEALIIAALDGREDFRVIDGRLQALRRKGVIRYDSKRRDIAGGWVMAEGKTYA